MPQAALLITIFRGAKKVKLMKTLICFTLLLLSACEPRYTERTGYKLPKELEDCKFYELYDSNAERIKITRCPNSQTSTNYRNGKHDGTHVVIERTQ